MKKKKEDEAESKTKRARVLQGMNAVRFWGLSIALLFIENMWPFSQLSGKMFRQVLLEDKPERLHNMSGDTLRRHIIELYIATKLSTISALAEVKRIAGGLPAFHLNIDCWTSKFSGQKYLGIRIYFIDKHFNYISKLLAVKLFNPSSQLRANIPRLSNIMKVWVEAVLEEFGLVANDIMSCTTDAGSDIRRLGSILLGCKWEWCIPHLLNCALVDSFGSSLNPNMSKNVLARAVIGRAKKLIEFVNKSHPAQTCLQEVQLEHAESALRLISDVPQRWKSTANLLQRILFLWKDVRLMMSRLGKPFPNDADHPLLLQLYSLMSPITDLITTAQGASVPEAHRVIGTLLFLKQTVLNIAAPLTIIDPATGSIPFQIPADQLHSVTKHTRQLLIKAIDNRFFDRYQNLSHRSGMFDLCCFFYPPFNSLMYIRPLLSSFPSGDTTADAIRENTEREIFDLTLLHATNRAQPDVIVIPPSPSTTTTSLVHSTPTLEGTITMAMFGAQMQPAAAPSPSTATTESRVQDEIAQYQATHETMASLPFSNILKFWRENERTFPNLASVARVVLGFAASAAGIERDFSVAGDTITRKRASLDDALVEMMLFLNINQADVPSLNEVKALQEQATLLSVLPDRFHLRVFRDVQAMSISADDADTDDVDADAEPLLPDIFLTNEANTNSPGEADDD